jgi:hypothetical protein
MLMLAATTAQGGGATWLMYLVAALFFLVGGLCVVSIILSIPGAWILLALALIIELCDGLYLPPESAQTFPWWLLGVCAGLHHLEKHLEHWKDWWDLQWEHQMD